MTEQEFYMPVLIIGYGNTLRGDDGFGKYVASLLAERVQDPDVLILMPQQLTPDLAAQVAASRMTIFIDARVGENPGRVHHTTIQAPDRATPTFQHHITPEVLAGVTRALYGVVPEMHLLTAEATTFEVREGLSPALHDSAGDVIGQILTLISKSS